MFMIDKGLVKGEDRDSYYAKTKEGVMQRANSSKYKSEALALLFELHISYLYLRYVLMIVIHKRI